MKTKTISKWWVALVVGCLLSAGIFGLTAVASATTGSAGLVVTKTASVTEVTGATSASVTYTYTVKNTTAGPVTLTSLVDDKLGALPRATDDSDCQKGIELAAGASCSFSETVTVNGSYGSCVTNVFTASAATLSSGTLSGSASARVCFKQATTPTTSTSTPTTTTSTPTTTTTGPTMPPLKDLAPLSYASMSCGGQLTVVNPSNNPEVLVTYAQDLSKSDGQSVTLAPGGSVHLQVGSPTVDLQFSATDGTYTTYVVQDVSVSQAACADGSGVTPQPSTPAGPTVAPPTKQVAKKQPMVAQPAHTTPAAAAPKTGGEPGVNPLNFLIVGALLVTAAGFTARRLAVSGGGFRR
ncbi:MAG: hypothetical protein WAQ25_00985 [Candidatus Saccharimonas sp.]